jgi:hypothetical protein
MLWFLSSSQVFLALPPPSPPIVDEVQLHVPHLGGVREVAETKRAPRAKLPIVHPQPAPQAGGCS